MLQERGNIFGNRRSNYFAGVFMSQKPINWRAKLEKKQNPRIVEVEDEKGQKMMGGRRILIPTPLLVDEVIRTVPKGKLVTMGQIRKRLAENFKADHSCPLTTGIFVRISAETAVEDLKLGRKVESQITPCWRVVKDDGRLLEKFPGGPEEQAKWLIKEGFSIEPSKTKKPPKVKDFEKYLVNL